jgi:hypothetical protein
MTDDVTIRFAADVSDLQKGMQQATNAVETTSGALRNGAAQINATFASLSQAYVSNAAQKITTQQAAGAAEMSIARQQEQERYAIALGGVREQSAFIKEQAQLAQISRQEELSGLFALERQREDIERQHLISLQKDYQEGTAAYAAVQRRLEDLTSQSALRRQQIERGVTQQIYAEYRRSFEQIGSSVSTSIMGLIQGQQTLGRAAQKVALSIVQSFVQARVRMLADWLAGIAAQSSATAAGEATKTAAVAAGTTARAGLESTAAAASNAGAITSVLKSIWASAGATFAGIFGFLAPVMGPAAAGPAAAGEATVLGVASGLASFAVGAWSLPNDMVAQVHQGEMIVPAGPAEAFRSALAGGSAGVGAVHVHNATNFSVHAIDAAGVKQFLRNNGKQILRTINDSVRGGSHLGLSKLNGSI